MATAWQDWPEDRREALRAWLRANGISPSDVPIDGDLYITGGPGGTDHIHYEAFHLDSSGQKHLKERGNEVAVEKRTAPLLVAPPAWWEPHIKPTRDQLLAVLKRVKALADEEGERNQYIERARLRAVLEVGLEAEGVEP